WHNGCDQSDADAFLRNTGTDSIHAQWIRSLRDASREEAHFHQRRQHEETDYGSGQRRDKNRFGRGMRNFWVILLLLCLLCGKASAILTRIYGLVNFTNAPAQSNLFS